VSTVWGINLLNLIIPPAVVKFHNSCRSLDTIYHQISFSITKKILQKTKNHESKYGTNKMRSKTGGTLSSFICLQLLGNPENGIFSTISVTERCQTKTSPDS